MQDGMGGAGSRRDRTRCLRRGCSAELGSTGDEVRWRWSRNAVASVVVGVVAVVAIV